MRPVDLLSYAVFAALAGCAASPPSVKGDWQAQQRARLEREHRALSLDDAVATVIAQAPAPLPGSAQDPEPKLDQRLPERRGRGRRSFRHPWQPLEVTVDVGTGNVMARANGTRLSDRTDAVFARARLDTGSGGALHVDYWGSDTDLFKGAIISDGLAPRPATAGFAGVDVFPHVRLDCQLAECWSMPVRVGAFVDWQQLDHEAALVEREWLSIGPRLVLEPTYDMLVAENGSLQLFGRVGGDVGPAWFREEFANGSDRDVAARWSGEVGVGVRGVYGSMHAEIGYRLQHVTVGSAQGELFGSPSRTELQRQQLFVGFGLTF